MLNIIETAKVVIGTIRAKREMKRMVREAQNRSARQEELDAQAGRTAQERLWQTLKAGHQHTVRRAIWIFVASLGVSVGIDIALLALLPGEIAIPLVIVHNIWMPLFGYVRDKVTRRMSA